MQPTFWCQKLHWLFLCNPEELTKKKKEGLFPDVVSKNSISLAGYVFIILKISIPELFSRKILCFSGLVFTALNS